MSPLPDHVLLEFQPGPPPPGVTGRAAFQHLLEQVLDAERSGLDAVVLPQPGPSGLPFEPTTVIPALGGATDRISLIGQVDVTFAAPYHEARSLATADHLTHGRAGWELLAAPQPTEPALHGPISSVSTWARATEFVEVLRGLWDSWEDGAVLADKVAGVHADEARIHPLDHVGQHFSVAGPLNVPRSPQGHPPVSAVVDPAEVAAAEFARGALDLVLVESVEGLCDLAAGVPVLLIVDAPASDESAQEWFDAVSALLADGFVQGLRIRTAADRPLSAVLPLLTRQREALPPRTYREVLGAERPAGRRGTDVDGAPVSSRSAVVVAV